MPVYEYKCEEGHLTDRITSIKDYKPAIECPECKKTALRCFTQAPAVRGDYAGYQCPVTEKWIEGRRAHEENLKRTGCRVLEPGEREACIRNRAASEAAFDESIAETAADLVNKLDSREKEKLGAEMDAGLTAEVVRSTKTTA